MVKTWDLEIRESIPIQLVPGMIGTEISLRFMWRSYGILGVGLQAWEELFLRLEIEL